MGYPRGRSLGSPIPQVNHACAEIVEMEAVRLLKSSCGELAHMGANADRTNGVNIRPARVQAQGAGFVSRPTA